MRREDWELMNDAETTPEKRARTMQAIILRRCQREATQAALAVAMGVSEATVSRMLGEHLEKFCALLANAGIQILPPECMAVTREWARSVQALASMQMRSMDLDKHDCMESL